MRDAPGSGWIPRRPPRSARPPGAPRQQACPLTIPAVKEKPHASRPRTRLPQPGAPARAPPSLRLLAESVRCHVPVHPGTPATAANRSRSGSSTAR